MQSVFKLDTMTIVAKQNDRVWVVSDSLIHSSERVVKLVVRGIDKMNCLRVKFCPDLFYSLPFHDNILQSIAAKLIDILLVTGVV